MDQKITKLNGIKPDVESVMALALFRFIEKDDPTMLQKIDEEIKQLKSQKIWQAFDPSI